jgi:predicted transcriptional regulator of viral defense system
MSIELPADCRDLIALQRGVISRHQALASGLTADGIEARVRSGTWTRLQRGTYAAFTGRPSREALLWAALLRAGTGAAFSHQTAAELAGLADKTSTSVHITVPAGRHPARARKIPGVVIHRSGRIYAATHPSLLPPQTRVEETVVDLTQTAPALDEASAWLCKAAGRRLTTPQRLRQTIDARRRVRWRSELLAALEEVSADVHSLLELPVSQEASS